MTQDIATVKAALECTVEHLEGEHDGKVVVNADVFNALYDFAETALSSPPAAPTPDNNGWRDISTAPRDGEWIMAWWPTMSITQYPCICYSDGSLSNPSAFETVATNEYGSEEVYPAKWQPLPPPPALDKGE